MKELGANVHTITGQAQKRRRLPMRLAEYSKEGCAIIRNLILNVDGMKGTQCEHNVKSALGELEGVRKVEIDVPAKTVAISLDPAAVTENQIVNVIQNQGYKIK